VLMAGALPIEQVSPPGVGSVIVPVPQDGLAVAEAWIETVKLQDPLGLAWKAGEMFAVSPTARVVLSRDTACGAPPLILIVAATLFSGTSPVLTTVPVMVV